MMLPPKVSRSTIAAQSLGSVKVLVQPLKLSLLAIATAFLRRFKVAEIIDRHVQVFLLHRPYHESDHVLAQALNLYVGGACIEDVANLQHSEAARRIIGACRIPDPTTGGDFRPAVVAD